MERPNLRLPAPVKVAFPVGGLLDISTGDYIKGTHGQMVLNGGIAFVTGYLGPGNSFKTTIMRFSEISLMNRMFVTAGDDLYSSSYDTETNLSEQRITRLCQQPHFRFIAGTDLLEKGFWQATDKTVYSGNEYFEEKKDFLKTKREGRNAVKYATAFLDRDGKSAMKTLSVTLDDYDSLSRFDTDAVTKQLDDSEIGSSDQNTVSMNAGKAKSNMLGQIPFLSASSFNYTSFVAHIGKDFDISSGPGKRPPRKVLQGLEEGVVIKGVTNHFYYLILNCWYILVAKPLLNKTTLAPEYPRVPGEERRGDADLQIVQMKQLRGKNAGSMYVIQTIVSEKEGVLPYMSEWHYIKDTCKGFGIEGTQQNYHLTLAPDVSLQRTTVRQKLRESARLQRALNITSELAQLYEFKPELKDMLMTPEDLYKGLKEKGYDWEFILEHTRGWHTLNDELHPLFPFSTLDLCRAAKGTYHPYWLEKDCKTLVKEYDEKRIKFTYLPPINTYKDVEDHDDTEATA